MITLADYSFPSVKQILQCLLLLACGTVGGSLAMWLGLPLPFMLGGMVCGMLVTAIANQREVTLYYPRMLRMLFIGMIGTMIGSTFSPDVAKAIPTFAITLTVMSLYVFVAHGVGYLLCRHIGKFDKVTAFYSAMPGGLIEAVLLGKRGGGDVSILTLMHFLRLCMVVVTIPTLFYLWSGEVVGSAAGQSFESGPSDWMDVGVLCLITLIGLIAARFLHLPAGHLIGPMRCY